MFVAGNGLLLSPAGVDGAGTEKVPGFGRTVPEKSEAATGAAVLGNAADSCVDGRAAVSPAADGACLRWVVSLGALNIPAGLSWTVGAIEVFGTRGATSTIVLAALFEGPLAVGSWKPGKQLLAALDTGSLSLLEHVTPDANAPNSGGAESTTSTALGAEVPPAPPNTPKLLAVVASLLIVAKQAGAEAKAAAEDIELGNPGEKLPMG